MEAFLVSTLAVTIGEIGDKTQLLALLLAARFRRPGIIMAAVFAATLVNHALAGVLGGGVKASVDPDLLRWALALSFIAIALWTLKPDKIDEAEAQPVSGHGVFATTFIAFFLAEMGDKTQLATVALAAHFEGLFAVVMGTTVGMLIANAPVVFYGSKAQRRIPFRAIRYIASIIFALLGLAVLVRGV